MTALDTLAVIGAGCVLGVAVPWLFMRMLEPSLAEGTAAAVHNYRGALVSPGLGVVWLVWSGCATLGGFVGASVGAMTVLPVLLIAGPLGLVAFAAGLVDDAYGSGAAKGFRGHLRAMTRGRLTTGGLKLVAIGLASVAAGFAVAPVAQWAPPAIASSDGWRAPFAYVGGALLAGAAIALTSNFVNLTDLRPARALKTYSALAVMGVISVAASPVVASEMTSGGTARAVGAVALGLFAAGPVLAVWRFDAGERAMLGDAGANPMGAVAGMLIVTGLPMGGLVIYAALMFAANVASERVSFSRVIETVSVLRWFDRLGRPPETRDGEDTSDSLSHDRGPAE